MYTKRTKVNLKFVSVYHENRQNILQQLFQESN